MWDCPACGCQAIAPDLAFCPQCFEPKGDDMPKTNTAGSTNAWEEGEQPETEAAAGDAVPDSSAELAAEPKAKASAKTASAPVTPSPAPVQEPRPH